MKSASLAVVAGAVVSFASVVSASEPSQMAGDALRQAIAGKTVHLETPVGALPISYRADGTMSGESRQLAMYTGSVRDQGSWWVAGDRLCQRWARWLDGKTYCFTLRRDGTRVHWTRNDGVSGAATIARN